MIFIIIIGNTQTKTKMAGATVTTQSAYEESQGPIEIATEVIQPSKSARKKLRKENDRVNSMIGSDDEEIVITHEERERKKIMNENYIRHSVVGDDKK
jgi:hypothetical protein